MAFTKVVGSGIHTLANITSHNVHSSGIITATKFDGPFDNINVSGAATFTGNVTIRGILTYEDVKNVDAIGIVTARTGIKVLAGGANIVGVLTSSDGIFIPDNKKLEIGNQVGSGDLQIYHDTTHGKSFIQENGPASLHIQASNIVFDNAAGSKRYINLADGGAATIYFNNLPRIDTTLDGVDIGGTGSLKLPSGTTAQWNSSPTNGDLRYNTTTDGFEGYADGDWGPIGGVGAGGTWSSYTAGIATTKSVGINTNNFDDPDVVGAGNSFQGLYISNGMIIHDNVLNGNHYIGTSMSGLMAGPVTIDGNLEIDGNYVVV